MAKKVTINGTGLLSSISDAWGGTNESDSPAEIHGTNVPAGAEWGMNRGEVERFIKAQFGTKFGDFRTTEPDANNFIHLLCFATTADAEAYDEDPTQTSLIVKDLTIPISTASVDSYLAQLVTSRSTSINYLVTDGGSFEIPLRFNAIHVIAATSTQEMMSGNGTLYVERSQNGTTWTQVHRQNIAASTETTGYPVSIDLAGLLLDGTQNYIRLRTTYSFVNAGGDNVTIASTPIVLNVTSVSLTLEATTAWQEPQVDPSALSLAYTVRGTVARTLHLRVTGSVGTYETSQALTSAQTSATFSLVEMSAYGLLTHGIKTCEAWLTAGDETSGILESDHLVIRIMVVKSTSTEALNPRLLISEMKSTVENFVQTRLLAYAVYSPTLNGDGNIVNTGPAIPTTFVLTNSASSIITASQTRYSSILVTPSPGSKYYLDMTIEIEQDGDTLSSFLHATREVNGTPTDFLLESTGSGAIYLAVDNTGGFQPTAGSTFLLNPKQRNNDEDNPRTILNAKADNAEVASTWTNFRLGTEDGYIKDSNGESCLRIPAGRTLNIAYNPFALLYRSPNANLNIEMDVCIRNVTNEDDPILLLAEQVSGVWRGLRMTPMVGYMTTESWNADEESDFRWQEDERVHIAINIVNAVYPNAHNDALFSADKAAAAQGSMSLVRVFVNGIINREMVYTPSADEFCTAALSNGGFTIGQDGADIDIYSIRVWEGVALVPEAVLQNYISTLSDSDKKRRLKAENAIIDPNTGLIGLDYITGEGSVTGIKKNYLIWHGNEPYHEDAHKNETGYLEWGRYDDDGEYMPEYSGTLCLATKSLPQKNQGTTAKTYYYHNIQWKSSDVEETITIAVSLLHSSITAEWDAEYEWLDDNDEPTGEVGAWKLKGGCLGKNFPLPTESAVAYHAAGSDHSSVIVPDGWIDGNGYYRGPCACVAPGTPIFQKSVNKINYASSMQSHIIGVNRLYNELHTAIVGKNTMQNAVSTAVVAKHLEPFLFFTQSEGSTRAIFRGPCAWGAGKMDKPSWGYVKSAHSDFTMIEGADNDKPLTDMRVPWDDEAHGDDAAKVYYDPEEESWLYRLPNGETETCIDFDAGKTNDDDTPKEAIVGYIRNAWNFLYLHAPRVRHYNGTLTEFIVDAELAQRTITADTTEEERAAIEAAKLRVNTANKYWCHAEGGSATGDYLLKRYDFCDEEWVDAGLWDSTLGQYGVIDIRYGLMVSGEYVGDTDDPYHGALKAAWESLTEAQQAQDSYVAANLVGALVSDAKAYIGNYFKVASLQFHYAFENHFIAGTDNCSKNTYYVLDPSTHLFELHQDDVDTVLATDNSGLQSKPYYIDRMHPYGGANASVVAMTGDVDNTNILYEGYYNVLFDLCELMYEDTLELQTMMRSILEAMATLSGGMGSEESDGMSGVWKVLNRYIFDVQRYFPATVFNEAARIRYEFPELIGFLSDIRSVHPIKQSLGDQLQSELQFMKRRLVYMASYAAFGDFTPTSLRNSLTGLSEATESFGMQKFALPGSSSPSAYTFNLVPHQWIYPTGGRETSNLIDPHTRVAPGETFVLDINPGQASDLGVNVFGLNYYRELGNVGDMVANNGQANFTLNGRRLTKFVCVPTVFYTDENLPAFRVNNIIIGSATRLKEFNVKGASIGTGTLDISSLTLCEVVDLRNTKVSQVKTPETSTIETLRLPSTLTALSLTAQPNLSTIELEGVNALTQITMTGCPLLMGTPAQALIQRLITADTLRETQTSLIKMSGINWDSEIAKTLRWFISVVERGTCQLAGSIIMAAGQRLTYNEVVSLIVNYGDIRSESNGLYVSFTSYSITSDVLSISGRKYITTRLIVPDVDYPNHLGWWRQLGLVVANGNNVAVKLKDNGEYVPDVSWEFVEEGASTYVNFPDPYAPDVLVTMKSQRTVTIRVTLKTILGTSITCEKSLGLWDRVPEVGDFAWHDGQFDNEDDQSKIMVGTVVMRDMCEYNEHGDITKCRLIIHSMNNVGMPASTDGESENVPSYGGYNYKSAWGVYPSAAQGFSTSDALITYILSRISHTSVFDSPVPNLQNGYWYMRPNNYQAPSNVSPANGYVDSISTDAEGNTTYARVASQPVGDGLGYKDILADGRTGESDFAVEYNNHVMMKFADEVLKAVLEYFQVSDDELPAGTLATHGIPSNLQDLADVTQIIVDKVTNGFTAIDGTVYAAGEIDGPARFRELLFLAFRVCQCWSPAEVAANAITESELDAQYRHGKWMLPSQGILGRIFNFLYNSSGSVTIVDGAVTDCSRTAGASPRIDNANYDENGNMLNVEEAQLALYSNILYRSASRRSVPISASSGHWSSTEYNTNIARYVGFYDGYAYNGYKYYGYVLRPVAAYYYEADAE